LDDAEEAFRRHAGFATPEFPQLEAELAHAAALWNADNIGLLPREPRRVASGSGNATTGDRMGEAPSRSRDQSTLTYGRRPSLSAAALTRHRVHRDEVIPRREPKALDRHGAGVPTTIRLGRNHAYWL
jgi:hypothetical protein